MGGGAICQLIHRDFKKGPSRRVAGCNGPGELNQIICHLPNWVDI